MDSQHAQQSPSPAAESSSPLLEGLTEEQQQAVQHIDGPLLVLAGPGSGKTTVVTRRVAWLVDQGIPAWSVLALTFTNKAAGEMRERIDALIPEGAPGRRGLTVTTFHSFCARLLRRYAINAGLSENYSIYDMADQRDAIKTALKRADMTSRNWTPAAVLSEISNAKNKLMDAAAYAAEADEFYTRAIARAYTAYEAILRANDALDFDDLLLITARLLRDNASVRQELQQRYQYLLIDEYQDTNHAQFLIAHTLACAHSNLCVVGDPDQSIYGWRGADIRNILDFEQQYPDAQLIPLGQNFRSTGHIVGAAAHLISHNVQRKDKNLYTELDQGERPAVIGCRDEHHEAQLIVEEFRRLHHDQSLPWKDMAVLYRMNALSRVLEDAFRSAGVPYVIARGTAFYDRKEVKDALAYLRVLVNPHDEVSLRRIINTPTRGIGKTTIDRIELHAINNQMSFLEAMRDAGRIEGLSTRAVSAVGKFITMIERWRSDAAKPAHEASAGEALLGQESRGPLATLVDRVVRESGLEASFAKSKSEDDADRIENLGELISAASEFRAPMTDDPLMPMAGGSVREVAEEAGGGGASSDVTVLRQLAAFLESVALVSDADAINPQLGAVTLLTLHTAKGLEYTAVAIAGLEEGVLPHSRAIGSENELEEERRLCFVGMTRARRHLMMTRASVRTHRGLRERTIPSQFLRELPDEHVAMLDESGIEDDFTSMDDGDIAWGRSARDFAGRGSGGSAERQVKRQQPKREGVYVEPVYDDAGNAMADDYGGVGGISIGALVRHRRFGVGRIEAITRRPAGSSARVKFTDGVVKTLILEYAKLELIDS